MKREEEEEEEEEEYGADSPFLTSSAFLTAVSRFGIDAHVKSRR
jgi:hypothetical protein